LWKLLTDPKGPFLRYYQRWDRNMMVVWRHPDDEEIESFKIIAYRTPIGDTARRKAQDTVRKDTVRKHRKAADAMATPKKDTVRKETTAAKPAAEEEAPYRILREYEVEERGRRYVMQEWSNGDKIRAKCGD
jgi:hypothetical protein